MWSSISYHRVLPDEVEVLFSRYFTFEEPKKRPRLRESQGSRNRETFCLRADHTTGVKCRSANQTTQGEGFPVCSTRRLFDTLHPLRELRQLLCGVLWVSLNAGLMTASEKSPLG